MLTALGKEHAPDSAKRAGNGLQVSSLGRRLHRRPAARPRRARWELPGDVLGVSPDAMKFRGRAEARGSIPASYAGNVLAILMRISGLPKQEFPNTKASVATLLVWRIDLRSDQFVITLVMATSRSADVRLPRQFAGYTLALMFLNGPTAGVVSDTVYGMNCCATVPSNGRNNRTTN